MTSANKTTAFNDYNSEFYYVDSSNRGYYYPDSTKSGPPGPTLFWQTCEEIEMCEDAYERTGSSTYKGMITQLINGLNYYVSRNSSGTPTNDWASWDYYNDDIMWGCIALARAYQDTGTTAFLTQAEDEYNEVFSRAWDTNLGGGLWQYTSPSGNNGQKGECVNGTAVIAGWLLYKNTTGTGFNSQAQECWNWISANLYNSSTGEVADHENSNGTVDWSQWTYNYGTMIGAATLEYQETNTSSYLNYGHGAAYYCKANLTGQHVSGILNDEYGSGGGSSDSVGFKGIFCRWCMDYVKVVSDSTLSSWLVTNADSAWTYADNVGITWAQWWHATPSEPGNQLTAWECSSAAVAEQVTPTG
jgi:predicted alpha-1,6-mannanase (GH76 family)